MANLRGKLEKAEREAKDALRGRKVEDAEAASRQEEIERIREEMSEAGCA